MFGHARPMFLSIREAGARLDEHGGLAIRIDQLAEAIADADAFLAVARRCNVRRTSLRPPGRSGRYSGCDRRAFQCARTSASPHEPGTALLCERDAFALALADEMALELRECGEPLGLEPRAIRRAGPGRSSPSSVSETSPAARGGRAVITAVATVQGCIATLMACVLQHQGIELLATILQAA